MDGYKIIDFKGIDISDGAEISGIYDAIDTSNKPLVIANLNGGGTIMKPFFVGTVNKTATDYYCIAMPIGTPDGATTAVLQIEPGDIVSILIE